MFSRGYALASIAILATTFCVPAIARADDKPAEKKGESTKIEVFGEKMEVPAAFAKAKKKSPILQHEFQASEGDATARVTMMAASGSVKANVSRWKSQFGKVADENFKQEDKKIGKFKVITVDIMDGSYAERMGGGPFAGGKTVQRKNYSMAAAIIMDDQERKYFIKMIGPAKVVKANRSKFGEMLQSLSN